MRNKKDGLQNIPIKTTLQSNDLVIPNLIPDLHTAQKYLDSNNKYKKGSNPKLLK